MYLLTPLALATTVAELGTKYFILSTSSESRFNISNGSVDVADGLPEPLVSSINNEMFLSSKSGFNPEV